MRHIPHLQPAVSSEFVFHLSTDQVGVVTGASAAGPDTFKTVRLAAGNFMAGRAGEFRPATDDEIQKRHRVAALIRPLALPIL